MFEVVAEFVGDTAAVIGAAGLSKTVNWITLWLESEPK